MGTYILPDAADTLMAVHDVVAPIVERAKAQGGLPRIGSAEFIDASHLQRVAVLLIAAEGYVVASPEQRVKTAMAEASHDIATGMPAGLLSNYQPWKTTLANREKALAAPVSYHGGPVTWHQPEGEAA